MRMQCETDVFSRFPIHLRDLFCATEIPLGRIQVLVPLAQDFVYRLPIQGIDRALLNGFSPAGFR